MKKQLLLILSGFLLGQGSMFLVQSYFVTQSQFELIGNIGIGLGLLSLIQWATDGGGVFFLSKYEQQNKLNMELGSFIQARLLIGFLCSLFLIPLFYFDILNNQILSIITFSPLVLLIWSFNLTGVADSRKLNQILGPTSGLSWLFSAITLLLFSEHHNLGLFIGAAFCLGLLTTTLLQIYILKIPFDVLTNFKGRIDYIPKFKVVLGYSCAYISAQSYGRIIPILVNYFMGNMISGVYIYAKNFTNSVSQLIVFSRRVEFKKLVSAISEGVHFHSIFKAQKISLFISNIVFFLLIFTTYLTSISESKYIELAVICTIMAGLQIVWVLSSSLGQVFIVLEKTRSYSIVVLLTNLITLLLMYIFLGEDNVFIIFIFELLMYFSQILIYVYLLRNEPGKSIELKARAIYGK